MTLMYQPGAICANLSRALSLSQNMETKWYKILMLKGGVRKMHDSVLLTTVRSLGREANKASPAFRWSLQHQNQHASKRAERPQLGTTKCLAERALWQEDASPLVA